LAIAKSKAADRDAADEIKRLDAGKPEDKKKIVKLQSGIDTRAK
jgi:hypothetical protein